MTAFDLKRTFAEPGLRAILVIGPRFLDPLTAAALKCLVSFEQGDRMRRRAGGPGLILLSFIRTNIWLGVVWMAFIFLAK